MRTRFDCHLDGEALSGVDTCVAVEDLLERAPEMTWATARPARGQGTLLLGQRRAARQVRVRFALRDRSPARRGEAMEAVQRWSRGTRLELSTRPGRFLTVRCTALPDVESALRWGDALEMTFTAWEVPFWQDIRPSRTSLTGSGSVTGTLYAPGTAEEAPVSAHVTNVSDGPCDAVTLLSGDTRFTLTGLALAPGETLTADTDALDRLSLRVVGTDGTARSVMACRTADSSDALLLPCGGRGSVGVTMSAAFEAEMRVRGRWL